MEWNSPIESDEEHQVALARLWEVFHAEPGTPEGDEHAMLADLIEAYEEAHFPIDPPTDPVAVIEFWMDQKNLTQADLVPCIGSSDAVAEVLSYKRPVTPQMAQALEGLFRLEPGHIPLKPAAPAPTPPANRV